MTSLNTLKKVRKKAIIIVAHPDDESLFMGGTIAEFKKWRWRVLCVTDCDKRYNRQRRKELRKACRIYNRNGSNIKPVMLGIIKGENRLQKRAVAQKIKIFLDDFGMPDIVFTHNKDGDYGHKTHKFVHNVVKTLKLPKIYNFYIAAYKKSASKASGIKSLRNVEVIELSARSLRIKRQAIGVYLNGSQKTNLSKMKRMVRHALNSNIESFYKV